MKVEQLEKLVGGGKIFSATFIKRTTGEERTMTARLGVRKGVKGVGRKFDPTKKNLLGVYDMQKKAFRMIDATTIKEITVEGTKYTITK